MWEGALPTINELESSTAALKRGSLPGVEVTVLGQSRSGRCIEMLSIGSGPLSALVVGAPHPNEPVGCATIDGLVHRFLDNPEFLNSSGFRWHFIRAIDPDGLRLNEGWLTHPTLLGYFRHFFRPALARQPEYTFPLDLGDRVHDAPSPENLCWRKALELTRPHLQTSLHNADVGGVFFIMSDQDHQLASTLPELAGKYGLPLNVIGEPFGELPTYADGVFGFPQIRATPTIDQEQHGWAAGDTSASYAQSRYGTFSVTCEVPLWSMSGSSAAEQKLESGALLERQLTWAFEAERLIHASRLEETLEGDDDAREIGLAVAEARIALRRWIGVLTSLQPDQSISVQQDAMVRLALLRPVALLYRYARATGQEQAEWSAAAGQYLINAVAAATKEWDLNLIPIAKLVALQTDALLAAAESVEKRLRN